MLLDILLNNPSTWSSLSWETNSRSLGEDISGPLQKPEVYFRAHRSQPQDSGLSQTNHFIVTSFLRSILGYFFLRKQEEVYSFTLSVCVLTSVPPPPPNFYWEAYNSTLLLAFLCYPLTLVRVLMRSSCCLWLSVLSFIRVVCGPCRIRWRQTISSSQSSLRFFLSSYVQVSSLHVCQSKLSVYIFPSRKYHCFTNY
jgi:hypothetical protein